MPLQVVWYDNQKREQQFMAFTIQAVIWDLDGVIIDSADEHRRAWQRLAREEGREMTDVDFWATFGKRNDDIFASLWGTLPPEEVKALSDRKELYFRELIRDTAAPLPGAIELMRELHDSGYAQALASSTPVENIQLISDVLALKRYLTILVSGETVARGKPAPDIFLKAAAELHMDPKTCVVIEDAVAGVEAAHAAEMRCIAVAGNRDLPELRKAELMVKDLTEVDVERVQLLSKRA
jgi:beta-phosphoglucomutase